MTQTGQRMKASERREAVLAAAVTEFAARGLAGTSTEDVALRACGDFLRQGHADEGGGGDGPAGRRRAMDPVVFAMSPPAAASSPAAAPAPHQFFFGPKVSDYSLPGETR